MTCLTADEWLERLLDEGVSDAELLHASECPDCGSLRAQLHEMTNALQGLRVATPPAEVVDRAARLMAAPTRTERILSRLKEATRLTMVLDSAALAAVATRNQPSARATFGSAQRYLRFESSDWKVELHVVPLEGGRFNLAGRLAAPEDHGAFVVLAQSSKGFSYPRFSDELGHFEFAALPADQYVVRLELASTDAVLTPVDLR